MKVLEVLLHLSYPALPQAIPLKAETRVLWQQLFSDVSKFEDFRHFKSEMGGTGPDFRHIETGNGLW